MLENLNQNKGIESGRDAGEPEIKKEVIKSRSNARELETKLRDRIRARCSRTRKKRKGSNTSPMQENTKQNEGNESEHYAREPEKNEWIESRRDAGEPKTKRGDRIRARCWRT